MSATDISRMNDKQLRNEVQLLRDELAIMKRQYEDIIYNLDTDNFSQRIVKQGKDMYTKIEQNAEGISLQAEKLEENKQNLATLKITAEEIESEVFEENEDGTKTSKITQTADAIRAEIKTATDTLEGQFKNYSTIEQTDNKISLKVEEVKDYAEEYVTDILENGEYVTSTTFKTQFDIHANGIYSEVSETYETKSDASSSYSSLSSSISSVRQTANSISTRVGKVENGQFGEYTLFTQTSDTFDFDGKYMRIKSAIILTDNAGESAFSIFHNSSDDTVYMWGHSAGSYQYSPVVIGSKSTSQTQPIYLYDDKDDNLVATQGWVLENAGGGSGSGYAVFG